MENKTVTILLSRYVFFEYSNSASALNAVKQGNNYKIDKVHTFKVNLFTDFKKYEIISDDWEPPKPKPCKAASDLHSHLLDPDAYDQFCVVAGNPGNTTVQIWQNCAPEPVIVEDRPVSIGSMYFFFSVSSPFTTPFNSVSLNLPESFLETCNYGTVELYFSYHLEEFV